MSTKDKLEQTVVRIRGRMTGTGFFIGRDATILTCFHVVGDKETGELAEKEPVVTFNGEDYDARCIQISHDPQTLDVAILRLLDNELPPQASVLPLGKWGYDLESDQGFRTFGYRSADKVKGLSAESEIRGRIATASGIKLLQFESEAVGAEKIRQGMSGSPVYHKSTKQVVGMVALRFTEQGETIPCAIPIEAAADVWPRLKDRLWESDVLQELRAVLSIGEWFTEKTFRSFYERLPPDLVSFNELGEDKPGALLEQLVGQGLDRIYDLISYIRAQNPVIPLSELIQLPPVHSVDFVNRKDEAENACGRWAESNIFFDAPAGYGKTELLKVVKYKHFHEGWLCIDVKIPSNVDSAVDLARLIIKEAGFPPSMLDGGTDVKSGGVWLGALLDDRVEDFSTQGVVLLLDNLERLPEGEVGALIDFLFAIRKKVDLRVRLAGRYARSLWEKESEKKHFRIDTVSLTPFRFRYVKDTLSTVDHQTNDLDTYAAHLMHITGGHPGCMAQIVEGMDFSRPTEKHFGELQDHYQQLVLPFVEEIRKSIPPHLRSVFDTLSVFRRYNQRLLGKLVDSIEWEDSIENLEKALRSTRLVERDRGFIQDRIVRRLLALRLRWKDYKTFIKLCEDARDIYKQDLSQEFISRPEVIAMEGLYQELQLGYYRGDGSLETRVSLSDRFFNDILYLYLEKLKERECAPDAIANFKNKLEKDRYWEFRFSVNFFLRGKSYENKPYDRLLKRVSDFFA